MVYAGKLDLEKGGQLLADTFVEKLGAKGVTLIVVGNTNADDYGKKVENTFKKSQNRIIRFPTQTYEALACFYQASDLAVFPRQCSLSFYDVQACGIPVVSEDNNINIDRLQFNNGLSFRSGDVNDFRNKIVQIMKMSKEERNKMSHNAEQFVMKNYNYDSIAKKYMVEIMKSCECFGKKN